MVESRDLVSVSKIFSRPIFTSLGLEGFTSRLGLGLEGYRSRSQGYRSRSQGYCLGTLNIAKIWLSKTSVIQRVFSLLYLQVKNSENRWEKCQKFKEVQFRKWWRQFLKNLETSLGLRISDEVSVSNVVVSTTSLLFSVAKAKTKT